MWYSVRLGILASMYAILTVIANAGETPARSPNQLKPRKIESVVDLQKSLMAGGFIRNGNRWLQSPAIMQEFIEYGSKDLLKRYQDADQFNREDIQKEIAAHQKHLSEQAFLCRGLPIQVLDLGNFREENGLPVSTRLGLRLSLLADRTKSVHTGALDSVRTCRADWSEYWYLLDESNIRRCRTRAEILQAQKEDRKLFHPDALWTDLISVLLVERDKAKEISRNINDYTVDLIITGLFVGKPLEWGFYLRSDLLKERGDCDALASFNRTGAFGFGNPKYFQIETAKQDPCPQGHLAALALRDLEGKITACYLADKSYQTLLEMKGSAIDRDVASGRSFSGRGTPNSESTPKLLSSLTADLKASKTSTRVAALIALAKMETEAAPACPAVLELLADKNPAVRRQAIATFAAVGPRAVPTLVEGLKSSTSLTRQGAVQALALLGPSAKRSVPALVDALKDANVLVRRGAAYALGQIGPEAKEAVPALAALSKDKDLSVRTIAATAIRTIEAPSRR